MTWQNRLGYAAKRWLEAHPTATPEAFVAECSDPKVLLSALKAMKGEGALDADVLGRAEKAVNAQYDGNLPPLDTYADSASKRLEEMLAASRKAYADRIAASQCLLIRAAVPEFADAITRASEVGAVMAQVRRLAEAIHGAAKVAVDQGTTDDVPFVRVTVTGASGAVSEKGATEALAWDAMLERMREIADRAAQTARDEAKRATTRAEVLAKALKGSP
jgi:hypothetical protein